MNVNAVKYEKPALAMSDFVNAVTRPYIEGLLRGAVLSGHSPETILEKAGLPRDLLADPEACIDGEELQRLLLAIETQTNDYFMGFLEQPAKPLMVWEQFKMRSRAKVFGEFIRISTQFREAIRNDVHYEYLMDRDHQEFTLTVEYKLRQGIDEHIFYWHRLMLIYRYWSWVIGKRIKLNRVSFTTPEPDYCLDYKTLFNCEVLYGQPYNGVSFDTHYLQNPVIRRESETIDFVVDYPDWLDIPGRDRSWTRQVEDVLIRLQKEDIWYPTTDQVAEILSTTARTLRQLLYKENENFHNIKQRVRCDAAKKLLTTTDTPITLVANQVGYSEPGVFTRAFIGWTTMTPSAYRAEYQIKTDIKAT